MTEAVLALDQGGHASRACVVTTEGRVLAESLVSVGTRHGGSGEVEHDPDELAESLLRVARTVLRQAHELLNAPDRLLVRGAGLATQRSTLVCFERHSTRTLSAAISWQDRRHAAWLASFEPHAQRVRALTGLPLSPHYGVAKMRWCVESLPAVRAAAQRDALQMAPLAAFLQARLTGAPARVDPANASRTLLYDSVRHDWSPELLTLFGIERRWLPDSSATHDQFGLLEIDAQTSIPLCALTGDQSAVPFAFGVPRSDTIYVNLGTGAFLQRPLHARPADAWPLLASVLALGSPAPSDTWYCLEGTVNGAGSALTAYSTETGVEERLLWQQLEQLPVDRALPLFVNGVGGLGSPYWRTSQPCYFLGEGAPLERFAAVLESIVFLIATNVDRMRRVGGAPARILLSGGLSRSDWLCQRLTDCLDMPVERGTVEATALGIAALAGARAAAQVTDRFEPRAPGAARVALTGRRALFDAQLQPS